MIKDKENNGLEGKVFLTILADGRFHKKCTEETVGAVKREIKDKVTGEVTDTVFETLHDSVVGKITGITIIEGKFGKNLQITIDDEVISTGIKGKFGEDLLKKLPAIDYTKDNITLTPYSFIPKGKDNKIAGVSVYQGSIKLGSYYYDPETKKSVNGCPEPDNDGKGFDSDDWTEHFNKVRKYMIKVAEKLPVFKETVVEQEKINADEIPF